MVQVSVQLPPPQRPPLIPLPKTSPPESRVAPPCVFPQPAFPCLAIACLFIVLPISPSVYGIHKARPWCLVCCVSHPTPLPGGHGDTRLAARRQEADPHVLTSPAQPRAAAACLRALCYMGRLAHRRCSPAKGFILAPGSGRAAGGACTVPIINSRCCGVKLPGFKSQFCQLPAV